MLIGWTQRVGPSAEVAEGPDLSDSDTRPECHPGELSKFSTLNRES